MARRHRYPPAPMTLTVVGSIAFDAVKTPVGEPRPAARRLGRALLAGRLVLRRVRPVGPVGDDFGEAEYDVLRARGVIIDDIEHVPGGKTFFWPGRYERDLNIRHTLQTDLNVFEHFAPKLSDAPRPPTSLFLANIQPDLQREVREQCAGALRRAGHDEPVDRHRARSLLQTIERRRLLILNDDELGSSPTSRTSCRPRARCSSSGRACGRQAGRVRRRAVHREGFFGAARLPARRRRGPDGRRRLVRRRLHGLRGGARRRGARRGRCCAARWPTAPRSPRSTSRSSAPSACSA